MKTRKETLWIATTNRPNTKAKNKEIIGRKLSEAKALSSLLFLYFIKIIISFVVLLCHVFCIFPVWEERLR